MSRAPAVVAFALLAALGSGCNCQGKTTLPPTCEGDACDAGCTGSSCMHPCTGDACMQPGDQSTCQDKVTAPSAATGDWQRTGPSGGRVTAVLSIPGAVLAATGFTRGFGLVQGQGGSVFRSTDQGKTYSAVLRIPGATVSTMIRAPSGKVYLSLSGLGPSTMSGVWVSTDDGQHFAEDAAGLFPGAAVRAIAAAPGTPERLYALVAGTMADPGSAVSSVWVRDDAGMWTMAAGTGVDPTMGGPALAMAADGSDKNTVYLADGANFYVSTDSGGSFTVRATGNAFFGPTMSLANVSFLRVDPASAMHLMVGTQDDGLIESTDQGTTWVHTQTPYTVNDAQLLQGRALIATLNLGLLAGADFSHLARVGTCLVDPTVTAVTSLVDQADTIVAGTTGGIYVSTDAGKTFTAGQGLDEVLGRLTVAGDSIWLMSAAGLYRTTDGAQNWNRVAAGIGTIAFSDVAVDPADADHLYLASDEDLYESRSTAISLTSFHVKDGTYSHPTGLARNVAAVAIDPSKPGRVYAYQRQGVQDQGTQPIVTGVFVSTDDGATFSATQATSESLVLKSTWRFSPLAVKANGEVLAGVVASSNAPTLDALTDPAQAPTAPWSEPTFIPFGVKLSSAGDVYLYGKNGPNGLRKSTDDGVTFVPNDSGLMSFAEQVYSVGFGPNGAVVVGTQAGVFYAADGTNFVALPFTDPQPPVWSVAVSSTSPAVVIATTAAGVYRRTVP